MLGSSSVAAQLAASQEGLRSVKLVSSGIIIEHYFHAFVMALMFPYKMFLLIRLQLLLGIITLRLL
jgi:hypothetical protein